MKLMIEFEIPKEQEQYNAAIDALKMKESIHIFSDWLETQCSTNLSTERKEVLESVHNTFKRMVSKRD